MVLIEVVVMETVVTVVAMVLMEAVVVMVVAMAMTMVVDSGGGDGCGDSGGNSDGCDDSGGNGDFVDGGGSDGRSMMVDKIQRIVIKRRMILKCPANPRLGLLSKILFLFFTKETRFKFNV